MIYNLELAAHTCMCKVHVNGLQVDLLDASKVGTLMYPCNTELIGKKNRVGIEVMPNSIDMDTLNKIRVEVVIKKYKPDEFTGPELGEVIATESLYRTIEMIKANPLAANINDLVPFQLILEFDSEYAPSFANRLIEAEPLESEAHVMEWALQFRQLLANRDVDGLYAACTPKYDDYAIAFPDDEGAFSRAWFEQWMQEKIFPQNPITNFTQDDLVIKKWCSDRIWEIRLKNGLPLWSTAGLEGTKTGIDIYVGLVDGKIKIVR